MVDSTLILGVVIMILLAIIGVLLFANNNLVNEVKALTAKKYGHD